MASPYAVPATVRQLLTEITETLADDDAVDYYSTNIVDVEINALLGAVVAVPFVENPAVVTLIANRWVAAEIVNARIQQDDDESQWAAKQRARGQSLIDRILSGQIDIGADDTGDSGSVTKLLTVTDHSVLPSTSVFVGTNSAGWNSVTETRDGSSARNNT